MERTTTRLLVVGVVLTAMLGLVGFLIAAEAALLLGPSPANVRQQAWRLLTLTAVTTGLVAGVVGAGYFGVVDVVGGGQSPSQSIFGLFEGGLIFGVPGLVLGVLVGSVLALDHRRREARKQAVGHDLRVH